MSKPRTLIHKEVAIIDQPIKMVWAKISDFGGIQKWMPAIEECTLKGVGIGAVRTVAFKGHSMDERLEALDTVSHTSVVRLLDPTGYPMRGCFDTISLEAKSAGKTQITWISDAEEVDDAGLAEIAPAFAPVIRQNISILQNGS